MKNSIGWNFPSNNNGQIMGISEAGIETFKGSLISSLTREICQNSLDAFESDKKPVIIEFELYKIKNTDVPGYAELKDAMLKCARFWRKQNNIKTANFFDKAVEIMNKNYIRVLRVSDYNTKGLTGSDKLYNTPWQNLVKSNGVSDKGSSAGGSFGIGKSAPFACSDLRTVFYRTLDENGLRASQGVSKLVSFLKDKDDITAGIGYYGEVDKNTSVKYIQELENINVRNEKGTDIFIVGFLNEESWKKNLIVELLESFLLAILGGNLEVIIEGEVINKDILLPYIHLRNLCCSCNLHIRIIYPVIYYFFITMNLCTWWDMHMDNNLIFIIYYLWRQIYCRRKQRRVTNATDKILNHIRSCFF